MTLLMQAEMRDQESLRNKPVTIKESLSKDNVKTN